MKKRGYAYMLIVFMLVSFFVTCWGDVAFAAAKPPGEHPAGSGSTTLMTFTGDVRPLVGMLRGMVRLARITMMFVAALLGIICGVMWYTGQQQAQGMLQKFFVAVFFIFGATAILDAILGMTLGNITVDTKKQSSDMTVSNKQWMGQ